VRGRRSPPRAARHDNRSARGLPQEACPRGLDNNRHRVERLWARLKQWRAVATRYQKTAQSVMGVLCLAAVFDWIKKDIKPEQDLVF
jgi:transposase